MLYLIVVIFQPLRLLIREFFEAYVRVVNISNIEPFEILLLLVQFFYVLVDVIAS